jgi:hypothetical protein
MSSTTTIRPEHNSGTLELKSGESQMLIREQLKRLIESHLFRNGKRYPNLLRYCVERTLGVEVLGRHPDYDSNADSVVRASLTETRKRIAPYYHDPLHSTELRIEPLLGSYVPEFRGWSRIVGWRPSRPCLSKPHLAAATCKEAQHLEIITRDPQKVPCPTSDYWKVFPERNGAYVAGMIKFVNADKSQSLPLMDNLPSAGRSGLTKTICGFASGTRIKRISWPDTRRLSGRPDSSAAFRRVPWTSGCIIPAPQASSAAIGGGAPGVPTYRNGVQVSVIF